MRKSRMPWWICARSAASLTSNSRRCPCATSIPARYWGLGGRTASSSLRALFMSDLATTIRRRGLWQSRLLLRAYTLVRRAFDAVGIQLVLKTYYSPIPDIRRLPADIWSQPDPMRGIAFDLDAQVGA